MSKKNLIAAGFLTLAATFAFAQSETSEPGNMMGMGNRSMPMMERMNTMMDRMGAMMDRCGAMMDQRTDQSASE